MKKETWMDRLNYELTMAKIDEAQKRWEADEPPIEVELIDIADEEVILFI